MGTSGPGIFADDVAADVRDEYLSMLAEGCSDKQALETILADWEESVADEDEGPVVSQGWRVMKYQRPTLGDY